MKISVGLFTLLLTCYHWGAREQVDAVEWPGLTVVQRKFDFTRLAESALLDDFEIVKSAAVDTTSSSVTTSSTHLMAAAAADRDRGCRTTLNATPTPRRNVAFLEPISKHVCVWS